MTDRRIDKRLSVVEETAARMAPPPAEVSEGERAFLDAIGVADWSDIPCDDLCRISQLAHEAPGFTHPLLVTACIAPPEDREVPMPPVPAGPRPCHPAHPHLPLEDPRWLPVDTPEWRAYKLWQRRRWGHLKAENDPEAAVIAEHIRAWAASPERPYMRGADLSLLFSRIGIDWPEMRFYELKRLVALCDALDELAREHPELDVPPEVFRAVLGWGEGDRRRCGGHPA